MEHLVTAIQPAIQPAFIALIAAVRLNDLMRFAVANEDDAAVVIRAVAKGAHHQLIGGGYAVTRAAPELFACNRKSVIMLGDAVGYRHAGQRGPHIPERAQVLAL